MSTPELERGDDHDVSSVAGLAALRIGAARAGLLVVVDDVDE